MYEYRVRAVDAMKERHHYSLDEALRIIKLLWIRPGGASRSAVQEQSGMHGEGPRDSKDPVHVTGVSLGWVSD